MVGQVSGWSTVENSDKSGELSLLQAHAESPTVRCPGGILGDVKRPTIVVTKSPRAGRTLRVVQRGNEWFAGS